MRRAGRCCVTQTLATGWGRAQSPVRVLVPEANGARDDRAYAVSLWYAFYRAHRQVSAMDSICARGDVSEEGAVHSYHDPRWVGVEGVSGARGRYLYSSVECFVILVHVRQSNDVVAISPFRSGYHKDSVRAVGIEYSWKSQFVGQVGRITGGRAVGKGCYCVVTSQWRSCGAVSL